MDNTNRYKVIADRDSRYDGHFYFAVKTTGIVCRPSCPASRPLEKNTTFYNTLDEALRDGFRTCKRCRPETILPGGIAQSLKLLNGNSLVGTAKELGITDRHFRRVVNAQIGTSPHKLMQSRRLLVAKNFLSHTKLPIIDIAFSAEFNSLRQFNASFRNIVGITPTEYRAKRNDDASSFTEATELTVRLSFKQPFEWLPLKSALLAHMIPGLEIVDHKTQTLKRLIKINTLRSVPISIDLSEPHDAIEVVIKVMEMTDIDPVVNILKRVFDLDSQPSKVESALADDPIIGPLFAEHPGLRVCGMFDPFELLINTIIGQQVSIPAARTFSERLVKEYGGKIENFHTYPTALALVAANPIEIYEKTKLNHKKIATIQAVCQLIVDGFELSAITHDIGARERLLSVKGIGPWTVEYVILRGFGDPDGFPADDLIIKRLLNVKTAKAAEKIAEKWRPYRGYATMQLWTKGAYE